MYRIDHYVAGYMTRYLPWRRLFPTEAKKVLRVKPPRLPREIMFSMVDIIHTY